VLFWVITQQMVRITQKNAVLSYFAAKHEITQRCICKLTHIMQTGVDEY